MNFCFGKIFSNLPVAVRLRDLVVAIRGVLLVALHCTSFNTAQLAIFISKNTNFRDLFVSRWVLYKIRHFCPRVRHYADFSGKTVDDVNC